LVIVVEVEVKVKVEVPCRSLHSVRAGRLR
jgi:hypothetical protein